MFEETEMNKVLHSERVVESSSTHEYNLRPSRARDYSYKFSFLSVNAGLKKWGDEARNVLMDELNLFVKEEVFEVVENPSELQMKMHYICIVLLLRREMAE
jgi:hypothetical protein